MNTTDAALVAESKMQPVAEAERHCPKCGSAGDTLPELPMLGYRWLRCFRRHCGHMWIVRTPDPASGTSEPQAR